VNKKVCFVVMGFGRKTDHETGKTFDLDATYEAIIQPAVEEAGFRCIRADEILHSGIIDTEMYKMLYQADLVIADISTGNVNAVYELGVRHALRPSSTIIMKEDEGRFSFDLDHTSTFQYKHLGDDIGVRESKRARSALKELISSAMKAQETDSPVYTYLPKLNKPLFSEEKFEEKVTEIEESNKYLHDVLHDGYVAIKESDFLTAIAAFQLADKLTNSDPHVVQKLALSTYKSEIPNKVQALKNALIIIEKLAPYESNDPETCGLTGAIHKRLWQIESNAKDLELAVKQYGRGFEIRRDYYNGENFATCLDMTANTQSCAYEAIYNRMRAFKVREQVIDALGILIVDESFEDRSDKKWIFATLSNCYRAIGNSSDADKFESLFNVEDIADWESNTFNEGKELAAEVYSSYQKQITSNKINKF
jgi:tetratricopeptide (TPR) repeat protein